MFSHQSVLPLLINRNIYHTAILVRNTVLNFFLPIKRTETWQCARSCNMSGRAPNNDVKLQDRLVASIILGTCSLIFHCNLLHFPYINKQGWKVYGFLLACLWKKERTAFSQNFWGFCKPSCHYRIFRRITRGIFLKCLVVRLVQQCDLHMI